MTLAAGVRSFAEGLFVLWDIENQGPVFEDGSG
jgi:hypothetical protein